MDLGHFRLLLNGDMSGHPYVNRLVVLEVAQVDLRAYQSCLRFVWQTQTLLAHFLFYFHRLACFVTLALALSSHHFDSVVAAAVAFVVAAVPAVSGCAAAASVAHGPYVVAATVSVAAAAAVVAEVSVGLLVPAVPVAADDTAALVAAAAVAAWVVVVPAAAGPGGVGAAGSWI